ncbi:hypothetical protein V8F33_009701 [Rhypophila sp. PSN 637]
MSFHACIPMLLFLQVPESCCQIQDYKCTSIIYPPEVLMLLFPLPFYLCIGFALALLCYVTGPFIWYELVTVPLSFLICPRTFYARNIAETKLQMKMSQME